MANSNSARKRIRVNETKRIRNRTVRSAVRTKIIKARRLVLEETGPTTVEALRAAVQALDLAVEKGILHRNNANRRKSRLVTVYTKVTQAGEGTDKASAKATAAGGRKGSKTRKPSTSSRSKKPATAKA